MDIPTYNGTEDLLGGGWSAMTGRFYKS
jgi:hypothetical protein